jgi:DNA repair photolyase
MVTKDMADLERFDVPPAPVHLSNSTDPFQLLETDNGHTRIALEQILAHRTRFTTVTVLTKSPLLPVRLGYVELFQKLIELPLAHPRRDEFDRHDWPGFCVEVSLAFWRDEARNGFEANTPTVAERIEGIRALRAAGIPLVLRIDPLFPRPAPTTPSDAGTAWQGPPEAQTLEDLEDLVRFAREVGARHVVYSVAKVTQPRGRTLSDSMSALRATYKRTAAPEKLVFRGGSWRLPQEIAQAKVVTPFLEICGRYDIRAKHCKQNLIQTP